VRSLVEHPAELVDGDVGLAFGATANRPRERVREADPAVAAETLDWSARTPLIEGLERTVAFDRSELGRLPAC
jgi:nucleoside-diphosphate-sugar epimerase